MIIDCISDLHGEYPVLEGGDILILAGDLTGNNTIRAWKYFFDWTKEQAYKEKIYIAGNHDSMALHFCTNTDLLEVGLDDCIEPGLTYLCDSGIAIDYWEDLSPPFRASVVRKLNIWGCPWSLSFKGLNPKCAHFTGSEEDLKKKYDLIPDDTDILISHCPPWGILDENFHGYHCGSKELKNAIDRVKPRLVVFGHIHEQGGKRMGYKHMGYKHDTMCVNASILDERYYATNNPVRIGLR